MQYDISYEQKHNYVREFRKLNEEKHIDSRIWGTLIKCIILLYFFYNINMKFRTILNTQWNALLYFHLKWAPLSNQQARLLQAGRFTSTFPSPIVPCNLQVLPQHQQPRETQTLPALIRWIGEYLSWTILHPWPCSTSRAPFPPITDLLVGQQARLLFLRIS